MTRRADEAESAAATAEKREQQGECRGHSALQAARRADADQLTHDEPEIEPTRMNQDALQNVGVAAQVRAPQCAGFVQVRMGSLQVLAAAAQQLLAARAANPPAVAIDGVAQGGLAVPAATAALRFRDIGAQPDAFPITDAVGSCGNPCPRRSLDRRRPPAERRRVRPGPQGPCRRRCPYRRDRRVES